MDHSVFTYARIVYCLINRFSNALIIPLIALGLLNWFLEKITSGKVEYGDFYFFTALAILAIGFLRIAFTEVYLPIKNNGLFSDEILKFNWTNWVAVVFGEVDKAFASFFFLPLCYYFWKNDYDTIAIGAFIEKILPYLAFAYLLNVSIRYAFHRGKQTNLSE